MGAPTLGKRGAAPGPRRPSAQMEELGRAFRDVFRTLNRLRGRDTHLCGAELSHAQFELLIELQERGELSAGELATAARLSPATVDPECSSTSPPWAMSSACAPSWTAAWWSRA